MSHSHASNTDADAVSASANSSSRGTTASESSSELDENLCLSPGDEQNNSHAIIEGARGIGNVLAAEVASECYTVATAEYVAQLLNSHRAEAVVASGVLAADSKAAEWVVGLLCADSLPSAVRAAVLRSFAVCDGFDDIIRETLTVALVAAGIQPACLRVLSLPDSALEIRQVSRLLLTACSCEPAMETALRGAIQHELDLVGVEEPAQVVVDEAQALKTARLLAGLAGRATFHDGSIHYTQPILLQLAVETPGLLELVVRSLQDVPQCAALGMAEAVAGLCAHNFEQLLLAAGVLPPLLSILKRQPADDCQTANRHVILEAFSFLASTPSGQEALWEVDAVPLLMTALRNVTDTADDNAGDVMKQASKAIGHLGAHPSARAAVKELVDAGLASAAASCSEEVGQSLDITLSCIGWVMEAARGGARAAEHGGALPILSEILLSEDGTSVSMGMCKCITGLVENGTRAARVHLVREAGAVAGVVAVLQDNPSHAGGWEALAGLLTIPGALDESMRVGVAEILPHGLQSGGPAAVFAAKALEITCTTDAGLEAVLATGVVHTIAKLVVAAGDSEVEVGTDGGGGWGVETRWLAASWLATICLLANHEVRDAAAASCLRPVLRMLSQPWTVPLLFEDQVSDRLLCTVSNNYEEEIDSQQLAQGIADILADSKCGCDLAVGAMRALLVAAEAPNMAKLDRSAQLLCQLITPCYHALMEKGLPTELCRALELLQSQGEASWIEVLRCILAACRANEEAPGELLPAGIVPLLAPMLEPLCPDAAALAAYVCFYLSGSVCSSEELLEAGVPEGLLQLVRASPPRHPATQVTLLAIRNWLEEAEGRGEPQVVAAMVAADVPDALLHVLTSLNDPIFFDLGGVKDSGCALGRLGESEEGAAAIRQLFAAKGGEVAALNAAQWISEMDKGRSVLLGVDSFVDLLAASLAQPGLRSLAALNSIDNLSSGTEACRRAVMPLLPRVPPLLLDPAVETRTRDMAVAVLASFASAGASGLEALNQSGAFGVLVPAMQISHLRGAPASSCMEPCAQILRDALALDSTKAASGAVVSEVVQLLPADGKADMFSTSAANFRFASELIVQLGPGFGESYDLRAAAAAIDVVCAEGAVPKLLAIISPKDKWGLLCAEEGTVDKASEAFLSIMDAPEGMAMAQEAGALDVLIGLLHSCEGDEIQDAIAQLQNFSNATEDQYREVMMEAGLLSRLVPYLEAGPASSSGAFRLAVCVVQLLSSSGNSAQRTAVLSSGAVESIIRWSSRAWWYDSDTTERCFLVIGQYSAAISQSVGVIQSLVRMLEEGETAVAKAALVPLTSLVQGAFIGEGLEPSLFDVIPPIIVLLQSEEHGDVWDSCLGVLYNLARIYPTRVLDAAGDCVAMVSAGVLVLKPATEAARVLGVLGSASTKAAATIGSMVFRVLEHAENIDDGHALVVAETLTAVCERPEGSSAALQAGIVPKMAEVLSLTNSRDLRQAALALLVTMCEQNESGRLLARDAGLIPVVVEALSAGSKQASDAEVASAALKLMLVLSETEALHLALQEARPLEPLAELCETSSSDRSEALRTLANIYCEGIDVADKTAGGLGAKQPDGSDYGRVWGVLTKYHIEVEVSVSIADSIRDFKAGQPPRQLQSILASVRSLSTNEVLRKRLVSAGAARWLVQVLVMEGNPREGLRTRDLALAADCLRRCAYSHDLRPALVSAGAEAALEAAVTRGRNEGGESGSQLDNAAKTAISALRGELDVEDVSRAFVRSSSIAAARDNNCATGEATAAADERECEALSHLPHFNAFVSHKRADAQDFARSLHTILVSNGFSCFLDMDNLEELSDLELIVAGVDVLIFVLTDNIFDSYWCVRELAAAIVAKVPVVLITKEGARWRSQADGGTTVPFPPETLIAELEPAACRKAFATKALSHNNEYFSSFVAKLLDKVAQAVEGVATSFPPQDGFSSGQRAAVVKRQRLLKARRAEVATQPAVAEAEAGDGPSATVADALPSGSTSATVHASAAPAGGSRAGGPAPQAADDSATVPGASMERAAVQSSPKRGKAAVASARNDVWTSADETSFAGTQIASEGMDAPSEEVEMTRLNQQLQQLLAQQQQQAAAPASSGGMTCCVFYCCTNRVLPV